ncbi:hypothetical protein [Streptomyces katrae]|uniref:hypothetical protein n=1 Tax=Streptomyces katrae TaxID=68223 RepID=UPI0004C130FF|nr:hypothetical protein [Streptomyces katrae]
MIDLGRVIQADIASVYRAADHIRTWRIRPSFSAGTRSGFVASSCRDARRPVAYPGETAQFTILPVRSTLPPACPG